MDDVFDDDREKQTCTLNEYLDDVEERELVYFLVIYLFFFTLLILLGFLSFQVAWFWSGLLRNWTGNLFFYFDLFFLYI